MSQNLEIDKIIYMKDKNAKCSIYRSPTTELALRYGSYP